MRYRIEFRRSAERDLRAVPPDVRERVARALRTVLDQPRRRGVEKLTEAKGWRLRVGDYRVLYEIDDDAGVLAVFMIRHRSRVYRR